MLYGNQMAVALEKAGFQRPKEKPRRRKQFKCHKCGTLMRYIGNGNVMVCPACDLSFYIFDK